MKGKSQNTIKYLSEYVCARIVSGFRGRDGQLSFTEEDVKAAWKRSQSAYNRTAGRCEKCWKTLSWKNRGIKGAWGAWKVNPKNGIDAGDSSKLSNCEILCLNCYNKAQRPQASFTDLKARVVQAKKDFGKMAEDLFLQGMNTVEICKILELEDLPFEMFLEVLGFKSVKEWKNACSKIRRRQRAVDKEERKWNQQRQRCLERDKQRCIVCDREASDVHHIVPYIKSHSHKLENLATLCNSHHDAINSNLSMYQKKKLERVREYIKTINKRLGKNLVLAQAFTTKAGTIYYRIRET